MPAALFVGRLGLGERSLVRIGLGLRLGSVLIMDKSNAAVNNYLW